jgi:uncharacterized protein
MRISEFCHFVEGKNGLVAMYNALTLGVVIVDRSTANIFQQSARGIVPISKIQDLPHEQRENLLARLSENKLVFPLSENPDHDDYCQIRKGLNCANIGILYLLMTDACNFSCSYCYIESGMPENHVSSTMSLETAEKGIDLFAQVLRNNHDQVDPQIIIYGGEPLLNFSVLSKSMEYVAQLKMSGALPENTTITLNTNGSLIDEKIADALKEVDNLDVAISLDGPEDVHDACRKYHSGKGTFADTLRGSSLLLDRGISTGFSCTITKHNLDNLYEVSRWFVEEFGVKSFGFNILIDGPGMDDIKGDRDSYTQETASQIIRCFQYFREAGIHEDRIMRKVNAFIEGFIYFYDCGGCGQQIVISPQGKVGTCQAYCGNEKYFVNIDDGFDPHSHPIWDEWRHRSPLFMEQCKNCIALSVCGGGCPYSANVRSGSIWEIDESYCVHAKVTTEFLIKDLIKKVS